MTNTTKQASEIRNLVFEGGGAKGSAYAGSVKVLDELGLYKQIEKIAGTSAGAITASLLATGGGSAGLLKSVETTHFTQFIADKGGWFGDIKRALTYYGIHSGNEFVTLLKADIENFSGNANLTFHQLNNLVKEEPGRFKKLTVIASNLTKQKPEIFSADTHPNLPIWHAVRASISIPLVFEPVEIDNDLYVDGGLSWNYPIDLFDRHHSVGRTQDPQQRIVNPKTLGFFLEPQSLEPAGDQFSPERFEIDSLKSYALGLSGFMYQVANSQHLHQCDRERTVFIDDLGVKATDFALSKEKIEALINSGRLATSTYFNREIKRVS